MAVYFNRWHPLEFDAWSYGFRETVAHSLFSHTSGALPPPLLLRAIDTRPPPPTNPPTDDPFCAISTRDWWNPRFRQYSDTIHVNT